MDQRFGRVPHHIGNGFFRIDPEQMLQNGQERYLLRCVHHLAQNCVKHIQMRTQIHSIRTCMTASTKTANDKITTLSNWHMSIWLIINSIHNSSIIRLEGSFCFVLFWVPVGRRLLFSEMKFSSFQTRKPQVGSLPVRSCLLRNCLPHWKRETRRNKPSARYGKEVEKKILLKNEKEPEREREKETRRESDNYSTPTIIFINRVASVVLALCNLQLHAVGRKYDENKNKKKTPPPIPHR